VDVVNGRVMLSGTVGSLAEKGRATADAYVANVQGVDAEGLEVRLWARDEELRGDKYKDLTDADIRAAVEDALFYDPRVAAFNVTPEVTNGVATLRGTVDNLKAKKAAARTARHTVGVLQVANRLKVRPDTPVDAPALEDRIRASFERDPVVESPEITIDVQNGVAELFGSVDTAFERSWAEDLAARVSGVIAVRNYLAVTGYFDPYLYDPYLDDWYAGDAPDYYDPPETMKSDWTIREEIEEEFFWSPFVDGGDIDIEVDNGRATLTGHVDSWAEYSAASENAFDGGAVVVYNELEVR
jgi:osmotically-inducible protein OsmY